MADDELRGCDGLLGLVELNPGPARSTSTVVGDNEIFTRVDFDGTTWVGTGSLIREQGALPPISWEVTVVGHFWGPRRGVELGPAPLGPCKGPKDPPA